MITPMITPRSSPACNPSRALPSPSPSPTVLPSHEYDPTSDADLVLYSSDLDSLGSASLSSSSSSVDDGHTDDKETSSASELELVEFYVHSNVISLASPLFKEMLSSSSALNFNRGTELAQSQSHPRQSPPPLTPRRIPLPVRPHVLSVLLRFIYPLPDPEVASLDDLVPILSAAVKYELTGVVHALRKQLMLPGKFLEEDPIRVFAIAARFNLEEETRIASRYTLRINLMEHSLSPDLRHISAHTYHLLLSLHKQRAASATSLLKLPYNVKCPQCNTGHASYNAPKWWYEFYRRASVELQARPGNTDVVFGPRFLFDCVKAVQEGGCERCPGSFLESEGILEEMKRAIERLPDTI